MPPSRHTKTKAMSSRSTSTAEVTATTHDSDKYLFFWQTKHVNGWASQWYPSPFKAVVEIEKGVEEEVVFPTAEHWMMLQKALLFGDKEVARTVVGIKGTSHKEMQSVKGLGRKVTPFDEKVWARERERIVLEGSLHKFRQNEELRKKLLATGEREIVEASPRDKIWGIGMGESKALNVEKDKWGLNLLGKALVAARTELNG